MQIVLVIIAPHIEMDKIGGIIDLLIKGNRVAIRRIPYLPSLSRSPARIIEPATGAST